MGKGMPSKSSFKGTKNGGIDGATVGVGTALGQAILGPAVGTAAGGIAAAAMESDGTRRDRMAAIAVNEAVRQALVGGGN
jgi:outer membrane lipoprotein SlyB